MFIPLLLDHNAILISGQIYLTKVILYSAMKYIIRQLIPPAKVYPKRENQSISNTEKKKLKNKLCFSAGGYLYKYQDSFFCLLLF